MAVGAPGSADPITKSNWYWAPGNRWAWRNMRRLFPTARVGRGSGEASALPGALEDLGEISLADPFGGPNSTINEMLAATHADAFIVVKHGKILYERYFNGMRPQETHLLMSVTKSVVGALVGVLAGQGRIDPEEKLERLLPKLGETSFAGASLRQLIDMQVARPLSASYEAIDRAAGWLPAPWGASGLEDYLLQPGHPIGTHGQRFVYLTENTTLASLIVERLTGESFADLLQDAIWSKIGAQSDADLLIDAYQVPFSSAGLNTTLRDLARFGLMMLQGGRCNGEQIVPESWVDDIRQNGDVSAWKAGSTGPGAPPFQSALQGTSEYTEGRYRSFWWTADPKVGRFAGFGLGAQSLTLDPTADVVVAKFSSAPDPLSGSRAMLTQISAIDALIREIS